MTARKGKKKGKKNADEAREEALRPSPYLGYDRDNLGMYLMSREAYAIAESQFRRAVWLNPHERGFSAHLAWCFHKQGRDEEARECLVSVPEDMMDGRMKALLRLVENGLAGRTRRKPDADGC